jgi:uncharacterized protein with HEPN domain
LRSDRDRIADVLEAISRIEKYAARVGADELVDTWIIHHLEIIGEACRNVSPEFRNAHPGVPWVAIVGMRNALAHHYFGIDTDLVREALRRDLPDLKAKLQDTIREPR